MKKIFLFLLFIFVINPVFAGEYTVHKLENGQTVVIQEEHNNPIVTIDTWIRTGSVDENDSNNGVSHFLEHLFFKGTKTHPAGEFDKILESKGAVINAATSKDFTHYYIVIPSKFFDLALSLHADMLLNPQIPRKELEKERKVVLEEISKNESDPDRKLYKNLTSMMYTNHPYKREVIGSSNIIETIRREEILEYYNSHYAPSNMVTVIVGDVNTEDVLKKISQNFVSEPRKIEKNTFKREKALTEKISYIEKADVNSGYMLVGFRGAPIADNDTYALDVLATILGDGRSSKLYQSIKENKQLAYSIGASNSSLRDDGIFYISAQFTPGNVEKVEKAIFAEIEQIKKYGVTDKELAIGKSIIEKDTYYSRESVSNIATGIGYTLALTDNPDYYRDYLNNIAKVTAEDVKRAANKYLSENKAAVSILLPKDKNEVKTSNITPQVKEPVLDTQDGDYKKYTLGNNAKLLLTENDANDILAIEILIKGGCFLEKIPGTAMLTAGLMKQGSDKYTSAELAKLLDENGIKISFSSASDYFIVSLLTTKSKEEAALDILDEVINHPKFDDYELEKKRAEILQKIKQSEDEPLMLAVDELKALIYANSVYGNSNSVIEKSLPKITRNDIIEFYNNLFNSKNIIISANGKINEELLINKFSNMFTEKQGQEFDYSKVNIVPLAQYKENFTHKPELKTSWIVLGWRTDGILNEKDYAVFEVIDTILGSGMSSRLFRNIREQEGLAYQLGSSYSPKVKAGAFLSYIGTNPKTVEHSKNKILEEIERIKKEFVSEKELRDAKDRIAGSYIIGLETNAEKATMSAYDELLGKNLYRNGEYLKLIDSVTVSDIIETANKYLNNIYVLSIVGN